MPPEPLWSENGAAGGESRLCGALLLAAGLVGLVLLVDGAGRSSATYDETFYLETGARWWRTGDQEEISRAGSPLLFWKLQQVPVLWLLDHTGKGAWIDDPPAHEADLLTWVRIGGLWLWVVALAATAFWSRALAGPRAMALAGWWFALSPNLLAHGGLATMETPVTAFFTISCALFWGYMRSGSRRLLLGSGAAAGVAFSCKFTAVLLPFLLAPLQLAAGRGQGWPRAIRKMLAAMVVFVAAMLAADLVVTGFATLPASRQLGRHPSLERVLGARLAERVGKLIEMPIPQDWAGFIRQMQHQHSGASGYLLGERRMGGWRHYYLVAMLVKIPPLFWLVLAGRWVLRGRIPGAPARDVPIAIAVLFVVAASLGSSRNFGFRYLLPLAPLAIVWISGLAGAGRPALVLALVGLVGQAVATASVHPYELCYFNALAGGARGGRLILADSNLDWGQGLRALAQLERQRPAYRDLTLYYFGDTDPARYGVEARSYVVRAEKTGEDFPRRLECATAYLAVSCSLAWGPWGPEGYFRELEQLTPVAWTADGTMAIYRGSDLVRLRGGRVEARE